MRELVIVVNSLPPNPNRASRNWHANRKAQKDFGVLVRMCAVSYLNGWLEYQMAMRETINVDWEPLPRATISLQFVIPTSKRGPVPDVHNLLMGLKPAIDQLTARERGTGRNRTAGIGIIEDDGDGLTWGTVEVKREGDDEQTIITIRETK